MVFSKSYAYENSDVVYPEGVTTLNFSDKVSDKYFDRVCSYDDCFDYMGGDVKVFMKDFSNYLDSKSSTEYKEMIYSKGYPITKKFIILKINFFNIFFFRIFLISVINIDGLFF
ncbi:MAG: hypothetical protein L6V78_03710 [Clostridium sp.]|nr:MAG: hypothetical protein L6V78_03710 [Clostridium sp.]